MFFNVFGIVNPNADAVETIEKELKALIQQVKENEPGNISYTVYRQLNTENGQQTFVIHEIFTNEAAWEKHLHAPYSDKLSKKIADEGLCSERGMDIKIGGTPFLSNISIPRPSTIEYSITQTQGNDPQIVIVCGFRCDDCKSKFKLSESLEMEDEMEDAKD